MPHRIQLCETWVRCNVLLKFGTLEYHVRNKALTQPQLLTYLFFFSFFFLIGFQFCFLFFQVWVSLFSFFCQGHVGWEATIVDLSIFSFFSLFKHRQIVFSLAFSFVSFSSRCGFLFFLSFVTRDGRPQLLTYLFSFFFFLFSSLFKHRQIVLLQGNRVL